MTLRTLGICFFALSAFAMSAVAHAQPVVPKAQEVERQETRERTTAVRPIKQSEKQIARAQNQLNRHFSDAVVKPTLRECWSRVQGDGAIVFDFTYSRSGSRWVFDRIALIKSNLSAGQDEVALRCMQDSVGSTSFSVKLADLPGAYGPNFVARW